ncbi:Biopolymer transport protein ExbD/TolR [Hymenobacter gelipurpurascens]|uniref:Biopolymer transport protein ExbD/TolR n=1 Tax=Hymenobacter gelipurpurascens TaxID=89968 RepID=A0A212TMJ3_9BACT|nr:biopolymer transporter ExbD [Hymenobacter gelipurpurascens]SNC67195.1 Biopolymer transport protein ExbD/TolR [Hymenobacter gelipurpurascens]
MSVLSYSRRHCLKDVYGLPAVAGVALVLSLVLMSVGRLRSPADLPSIQLPVGHSDTVCRLWEVPVVQVTLDDSQRFYLQTHDSLLNAQLVPHAAPLTTASQVAQKLRDMTQLSHQFYHKPTAVWLRADQRISSREIMAVFYQLRQQGISRVFLVMETERT